jgi:hypothetical protein
LIAVTAGVGAPYAEMAELAAARVRAMTGLPAFVLGEREVRRRLPGMDLRRAALGARLVLFDIFPDADAVLHFDADVVALRPWDPRPLAGSDALVCVRDLWWHDAVALDARRLAVPLDRYFNAGLFIASRRAHEGLMRRAAERMARGSDLFLDQSALNVAAAEAGAPLRFLDRRFNFIGWSPASSLPVVCAHGVAPRPGAADKQATLALLRRPLAPRAREVDEEELVRLGGRRAWLRRAGGARVELELRADGTLGRGWTEDACFWVPVAGGSLLLCAQQTLTCELRRVAPDRWRGRFPRAHAPPGSPPRTAAETASGLPASWTRTPFPRRLARRAVRDLRSLLRHLAAAGVELELTLA